MTRELIPKGWSSRASAEGKAESRNCESRNHQSFAQRFFDFCFLFSSFLLFLAAFSFPDFWFVFPERDGCEVHPMEAKG